MSTPNADADLIWQIVSREGPAAVDALARVTQQAAREAEHHPRRGSAVEAWLKRTRDAYAERGFLAHGDNGAVFVKCPQYWALDELLDDYRERADTGSSLAADLKPEESS